MRPGTRVPLHAWASGKLFLAFMPARQRKPLLDGLVCVAVPVREAATATVRCAVALQAPAARMPLTQALTLVPRLNEAAAALARSF